MVRYASPPPMEPLTTPSLILLDWHATLVNTYPAMYRAVDDMLAEIEGLGLVQHLVGPAQGRTIEDAKLVRYVRRHRRLPAKIKDQRRVSRTDIFEVLFGDDEDAKSIAHQAFNACYRRHYGAVAPTEAGIPAVVKSLKQLGLPVGVATNRNREFMLHELDALEDGDWETLFDVIACGDDVQWPKPNPEVLVNALEKLDQRPTPDIWYVGDSMSDAAAAKKAGITSVFYNGAGWSDAWIRKIFPGNPKFPHQPDAVVEDFAALQSLARCCIEQAPGTASCNATAVRIFSRFSAAWSNDERLEAPTTILFDWHANLVDTLGAMYRAIDDVLPQFGKFGLVERLVDPALCKTVEDAKLVEYVRDRQRLHPKIKADRKISRTDIFEVLFGADAEAKLIAHESFNQCYHRHCGEVQPFEPGARDMLDELRRLRIRIGVLSNRDREFLDYELQLIEEGSWLWLFDTVVGGDEAQWRKPAPDPVLKALENLEESPSAACWYVGDSTTDTISAKLAGVTSVFYNGANWQPHWLIKMFPGTELHPHQPDAGVDNFAELLTLVKQTRA